MLNLSIKMAHLTPFLFRETHILNLARLNLAEQNRISRDFAKLGNRSQEDIFLSQQTQINCSY